MTIKITSSPYLKYILIGLIAILVLIAVYRGCRLNNLRDEYNQLKGEYATLKAQADKALKEALEYIKSQDARIAEQNKIITDKDKAIAEKYRTIAGLQSSITVLEAEYATLTDKDAKIVNLAAQVNQWKTKCLEFESIIKDKDDQLIAWKLKFDAQVGISEAWRNRYEAEHQLRLVADEALRVQEKRLKSFSFGSKIKTMAIIAVGGFIVYDQIRGKGK